MQCNRTSSPATYAESKAKIKSAADKNERALGGVEPLGISAATGLKPEPRTFEVQARLTEASGYTQAPGILGSECSAASSLMLLSEERNVKRKIKTGSLA